MIDQIAQHENQLRNIPNRNLKGIFDLIHRTLAYLELKYNKNEDDTPKDEEISA